MPSSSNRNYNFKLTDSRNFSTGCQNCRHDTNEIFFPKLRLVERQFGAKLLTISVQAGIAYSLSWDREQEWPGPQAARLQSSMGSRLPSVVILGSYAGPEINICIQIPSSLCHAIQIDVSTAQNEITRETVKTLIFLFFLSINLNDRIFYFSILRNYERKCFLFTFFYFVIFIIDTSSFEFQN